MVLSWAYFKLQVSIQLAYIHGYVLSIFQAASTCIPCIYSWFCAEHISSRKYLYTLHIFMVLCWVYLKKQVPVHLAYIHGSVLSIFQAASTCTPCIYSWFCAEYIWRCKYLYTLHIFMVLCWAYSKPQVPVHLTYIHDSKLSILQDSSTCTPCIYSWFCAEYISRYKYLHTLHIFMVLSWAYFKLQVSIQLAYIHGSKLRIFKMQVPVHLAYIRGSVLSIFQAASTCTPCTYS